MSRYTNPPARRIGEIPRKQNRAISNLSPHVIQPIQTTPTTARVHTWKLTEPEKVRPCIPQNIHKHFDADTWAVPGRYQTSYQAYAQEPYTGAPIKFPAVYN